MSTGATAIAHEPRKGLFGLSLTQTIGGALASTSAAYAGARLGVAGTILGAAMFSVIATVGGAIYTQSLRHTRDLVRKSTRAPYAAPADRALADETVDSRAEAVLVARAPWSVRRIALTALMLFVTVLGVVTGIELATGKAFDGGSGTTIGQVTHVTRATPTGSSGSPSTSGATSTDSPSSATSTSTGAPTSGTPSTGTATTTVTETTTTTAPSTSGSSTPPPTSGSSTAGVSTPADSGTTGTTDLPG